MLGVLARASSATSLRMGDNIGISDEVRPLEMKCVNTHEALCDEGRPLNGQGCGRRGVGLVRVTTYEAPKQSDELQTEGGESSSSLMTPNASNAPIPMHPCAHALVHPCRSRA